MQIGRIEQDVHRSASLRGARSVADRCAGVGAA